MKDISELREGIQYNVFFKETTALHHKNQSFTKCNLIQLTSNTAILLANNKNIDDFDEAKDEDIVIISKSDLKDKYVVIEN